MGSSPLGILPRLSLKIDETQLHAGDLLLMYANGAGPLDDSGVHALLRECPAGTAQEVADTMLGEVVRAAGGDARDDLVVIAVQVR